MLGRRGRLIAVVVCLAGLLWPLVGGDSSGSGGDDPAQITDYRADLSVTSDGTLHAVETVTTQMPDGRHGIFRFWDIADPSDAHVRLVPEHIAVTQDGGPATVELMWQDNRRYRVAKIGDADRTLSPGPHVYAISYDVKGALSPAGGGTSVFYWNVVPPGWQMRIGRSVETITLPVSPGTVACTVGTGTAQNCSTATSGNRVTVRTAALEPRTPVTVRVPLAMATPDRASVPWPVRYDGILTRSRLAVIAVLLLSGVGIVLGLAMGWRSHERRPGLPLLYAPPEAIGPVQAAYIVTEQVPKNAVTATLLYQAEQKLTKLTRHDEHWTVEGIGTSEQWAATDEVTRTLGEGLGVATLHGTFTTDGSVAQGRQLTEATKAVAAAVSAWARREALMRWSVPERVGRLLVYGAILLAILLFFVFRLGVSMVGLPPASFAIAGWPLVMPGAGTRRTDSGRELWSRAGGFERILSTPSSVERFDFSGRQEFYTSFIPWAVAFDCAKEWEKKYQTETGQAAPTPVWVYGYGGSGTPFSSGTLVDSFQSSLQSSIGAYQATQHSSSGGGFSGGGGGGGGGGGSW